MRQTVRKVAFVGEPDRDVAESLREYGYRLDGIRGDSVFALARDIYRFKPALIHARTNHLKAALVAKLFGIPLVAHAGRADVTQTTVHATRLADRTLCGGATVREALIALGAPQSRTCVVRSLVDVAAEVDAATFPPMLDPAIRWVVAAGPADSDSRGHSDLLLAFASVARTRPGLKLLIAGEGPEGRRLRALAAEGGMRTRVVVHPVSLEQLPAVLARAAAVVAPSRTSVPDPVPEALAVGAPVIATAIGSHPTWIREGRTGWLVPPRSPVALAARLAQVLDDGQLAARVGAAARKAALDLASPRAVAQELARTYAAVAGRTAAARVPGVYLPAVTRLSRA